MQLVTLFEKHNGKCYYCGHQTFLGRYGASRATRDHLLAKALGGRNGDNLVLACSRCNLLKDQLPAESFASLANRLPPPMTPLSGHARRRFLKAMNKQKNDELKE